MDEKLMDHILVTLGMLLADRNYRQESEQEVDETLWTPSGNDFHIIWNTGNTVDIVCYPGNEGIRAKKIATFYMDGPTIGYDRSFAMMIYGVITGYERALLKK